MLYLFALEQRIGILQNFKIITTNGMITAICHQTLTSHYIFWSSISICPHDTCWHMSMISHRPVFCKSKIWKFCIKILHIVIALSATELGKLPQAWTLTSGRLNLCISFRIWILPRQKFYNFIMHETWIIFIPFSSFQGSHNVNVTMYH